MKKQERKKNHEGSIFQRADKRWSSVISVGQGEDGKRKRVTLYGSTEAEVSQKLNELRPAFASGLAVDANKVLLADFLEQWMAYWKSTKWKENTVESYRQMLDAYILPYIAGVTFGRLNTLQVQSFFAAMENAGASPWRRLRAYMILHKAFEDAVAWKILYRSPMDGLKAPKVPKTYPISVLLKGELDRLLEAARGDRYESFFVVMALSGCRYGEVAALFWEDVNFEKGTIVIRRTLSRVKYQYKLGDPKTPSSFRTLDMPKYAMDSLREHKVRQKSLGFDIPLIFPNRDGGFLRHENFFTQSWKPLLVKAGLAPIRMHDLRHTHATLLLEQNVPVQIVQARLGHKNVETTLELYGHVLKTIQGEARRMLDTMFPEQTDRSGRLLSIRGPRDD